MTQAIKEIFKTKIYGIIREDDPEKAYEIANAYKEGGIKVIEINSGIDAIKKIAQIEDIYVAQGGIITSEQAHKGIEAGAKLLVSPILQMGLTKVSSASKIPLILSATTPNEAYSAWKVRVPIIKIFPIKDLGGSTYIEDLLRPMRFLNVMPCGSVKIEHIRPLLNAGACAVGMGRGLYLGKSYDETVKLTKEAVSKAQKA